MGFDFDFDFNFGAIRTIMMWGVIIFALIPIVMWFLRKGFSRIYDRFYPLDKHEAGILSRRLEVKTVDDKAVSSYYVTFALEDGRREEFETDVSDYAQNIEGEKGVLCLRNGEFVSFERY